MLMLQSLHEFLGSVVEKGRACIRAVADGWGDGRGFSLYGWQVRVARRDVYRVCQCRCAPLR